MKLTFIEPRPELRPYVESLWVFESDIGLPASDQKPWLLPTAARN